MRLYFTLIASLISFSLFSQWQGETDKYQILNDSLQLNDTIAGSAFLSYPLDIVDSAQWEFSVRLDFNPSSSNYALVYLKSEQAELSGNAYYVKIGGTNDEVSLFRQDGNKQSYEKIIDGVDERVDVSNVVMRVRVKFDQGVWELYSQKEGEAFQLEGTVEDNTYYLSSYFGVYAYYTKTRSKLISFYDFDWRGNAYQDTDAPRLDSLQVLTQNTLLFYFNEPLAAASFSYQDQAAESVTIDRNQVHISFANSFVHNDTFLVDFSVRDSVGNVNSSVANAYYKPFEVVFVDMISADSLMIEFNREPFAISEDNILLDQVHPQSLEFKNGQCFAVFETPFRERENYL